MIRECKNKFKLCTAYRDVCLIQMYDGNDSAQSVLSCCREPGTLTARKRECYREAGTLTAEKRRVTEGLEHYTEKECY